ncbi:LPS export ABC transporter permease LptG [Chromohalobacter israelensis]|uniref:LPS export ABC transporter permease LptG n=1 Tax=Chromohalobacter israelensis TaxID=141390 RepID=UPI000FFEE523|nr:LPS export ABC transporter permease LptG [Chromohalobacter salexigens]RXE49304.1 LPS export ABC transporter permease LptG [Chromohalobacter salexigens]
MIFDRFDRYIARNVLAAMLVVQVMILGLDLVISYINDLGDVEGDYGALDVLLYLLMRLPWRFYQYAPVGVLIGALIGLGSMASSNELTVMRASGRSLARILWGAMKPLGLVIIVTMAVSEWVSPVTEQYAEAWRLEQLEGEGAILSERGGWQREGDDFYRFGTIRADDVVIDVTRYHFDGTQLVSATHADRAVWEDGSWQWVNVDTTRFEDGRTVVDSQPRQAWETSFTPAQLNRLLRPLESQSPSDLWRYANYLSNQGLEATQPLLYFWQKMLLPFTLAGLMLVAASFVFGPLRTVAAGTRVFYGIIVGVSFKYLQDLLAPASMLFGFSPIFAVLVPTVACYVLGIVLLRRTG